MRADSAARDHEPVLLAGLMSEPYSVREFVDVTVPEYRTSEHTGLWANATYFEGPAGEMRTFDDDEIREHHLDLVSEWTVLCTCGEDDFPSIRRSLVEGPGLGRATRRYAYSADGQLPDATRTLLLQHWKDHLRGGDELDTLRTLWSEARAAERRAVAGVATVRRAGYSWAAIGRALDISRQAAQERFRAVAAADDSD